MEETKGVSSSSSKKPPPPKGRFTAEEGGEAGFECSGKHCAAALIADCVAVCCCPLAPVSLLALALVKVPYLVGRKCLRKRKNRKIRKCKKVEANSGVNSSSSSIIDINSKDISLITGRSSHTKSEIIFEFGKEGDQELEERSSFDAAFEAEKVFFELYQSGHMGFGRVSD